MTDGTYRGRWMDEVCGTPLVSAEVKVLLLTSARWMDDAGFTSVPRERLATLLRCHPRKITEKQKAAIDAGLFARISAGYRGRTAVFQARIPGVTAPERVPTVGTQSGDWVPTTSTLSEPERVPTTSTLSEDRVPTVGHQSTGKGADCRHPSTNTHRAEEDHDGAVVVPLFEESEKTTGKNTQRAKRAAPAPNRFDEFWAVYPRRIKKEDARKAWEKALKNGADPDAIIWGARAYASNPRRAAADIGYTAHASTWLNGKRWEDEPEPSPQTATRPTNQHHETAGDQLGDLFA